MESATVRTGRERMRALVIEWCSIVGILGLMTWGTVQLMSLLVQVLNQAVVPMGTWNAIAG